jgi:hypothetical protein
MKSAVLKKVASSFSRNGCSTADRFHRQQHAGDPLVALGLADGKGQVPAAQHRMADVLDVEVGLGQRLLRVARAAPAARCRPNCQNGSGGAHCGTFAVGEGIFWGSQMTETIVAYLRANAEQLDVDMAEALNIPLSSCARNRAAGCIGRRDLLPGDPLHRGPEDRGHQLPPVVRSTDAGARAQAGRQEGRRLGSKPVLSGLGRQSVLSA